MRFDLILSGIIGAILGWFVVPGVIFRIKRKRGIKSAPSKEKSVTCKDRQKDL